MISSFRSRRGPARGRSLGAALALALAGGTGACSSLGDNLPASLGPPANAPERPDVAPEFLPVHDLPPPRATKPLSAEERKKLESELVEARDRQERRTGKSSLKEEAQKSSKEEPRKSSAQGRSRPSDCASGDTACVKP